MKPYSPANKIKSLHRPRLALAFALKLRQLLLLLLTGTTPGTLDNLAPFYALLALAETLRLLPGLGTPPLKTVFHVELALAGVAFCDDELYIAHCCWCVRLASFVFIVV